MGRRVVYTSGTLSLAALELLVHTGEDLVPSALVHIEIEVPFAVVPQENNYLLNPEHPDATRFRVVTTQGLVLDPRLFY